MPCVHYKFHSRVTHDTLRFEGLHITVRELKRQIMKRERLKLCDLQISSVQTHEGGLSVSEQIGGKHVQMPVKQTENLAEANASEEDKLKAVMYQSSLCYYSSSDVRKLLGLLPPSYICFRCGIPGHHIRDCPTRGDKGFAPCKRIRKSAGIPRSFLVEVDDPGRKGVMVDRSGKYVIPIMDAVAYAIGKKEKPPFSPQSEPSSSSSSVPVPAALLCLICKDLLTDAVTTPCCGRSYCDECIRTCLLESDEHICPSCHQSDVSPDALTADVVLRQDVDHFRNGTRPSCSNQSPTRSHRSQSPAPSSSSERGRDARRKCSRSRSPLNRRLDQKRPRS